MFETAAWARRRVLELRRDFTWAEASGSVGDLGTFVPIAVGLTVRSGLDIGTTLTMTGLYNLATAFAFDVPMPVQPMKAIAAVALADPSVDLPQILSAGLFVSLVVFALGVAGLIDRFNRLAPRGLVHGVQVGIGTLLCLKALRLFLLDRRGRVRPAGGADGLVMGACALAFAALAESVGSRAAATTTAAATASASIDDSADVDADTVDANRETSPALDDASEAAADGAGGRRRRRWRWCSSARSSRRVARARSPRFASGPLPRVSCQSPLKPSRAACFSRGFRNFR